MEKYSSFVAFDVGTKNIGIAISHNITNIVHPIGTFKIINGNPDWAKIKDFLNEFKYLKSIIVGFPLNMDGTEQLFTFKVRKFSNQLQNRFNYNIIFHDERLSTFEAKLFLINSGKSFKKLKKDEIDAQSAAIILESWMYQQKNKNNI
ncbi:MAG: ribonuclease H-like domain containing nuclease [Candidatus Westeberhardia cardiocondylae]|nr:ribonuclease H-like domain containing nuclease [Candidatus Westeberhardia cardiocondylae]